MDAVESLTTRQREGPSRVSLGGNLINPCPFLGLGVDASTYALFPTDEHRCYARGTASVTALEQIRFCLSGNYSACGRYAAAGEESDTSVGEKRLRSLAMTVGGLLLLAAAAVLMLSQRSGETSLAGAEGGPVSRASAASTTAVPAGLPRPDFLITRTRALPGSAPRTHVVRSGESFEEIAASYGITVRDLELLNGPSGPLMRTGQLLLLPETPVPERLVSPTPPLLD